MPLADKSVFSPARTCADSQLLQDVLAWSSLFPRTPASLRGLKGLWRLSHCCFAMSLPPASEQKEEDPRASGVLIHQVTGTTPNPADPLMRNSAKAAWGSRQHCGVDRSKAGAEERYFGTNISHKAYSQKPFSPVWAARSFFSFELFAVKHPYHVFNPLSTLSSLFSSSFGVKALLT